MRLGTALGLALFALTAPARAGELRWHDEWPRFRVSEHVVSGAMAIGAAAIYIAPRTPPRWGGGLLFDDAVRRSLRAETISGRKTAGAIASTAYLALLAHPFITDAFLVPLARGSRDLATQLPLIDLEAFAFTALVFKITEATVARARPYVWDCMQATHDAARCHEGGLSGTNSFMSGHAGIAATGASLTCVTQLRLQLYGPLGSPIACGVAASLAVVAAVGRLVSDDHYATDVIVGAIAGVTAGFVLPSLLHYGFDGHGVGTTRSTAMSIAF